MELLQHFTAIKFLSTPRNHEFSKASPMCKSIHNSSLILSFRKNSRLISQRKLIPPNLTRGVGCRGGRPNVSKIEELLNQGGDGSEEEEEEEESTRNEGEGGDDEPQVMDADERREWRRRIREVMAKTPDVEEETDLLEKRKRMQKLLAEYPLVVEEDDPNWPEHDEGWGFNLGQFFNKITVKNVRKDDEDYDSDKEIEWKDDNYIRPIRDITYADWEEAIYKDISPLVVLVHNRYKRPKENEKIREELEQAVHIIWNCRLPSPRCIAVDANADPDLASGLQVSVFPELIFIRSGRIIYRDKAIRSADELSKIMAFFYFGAAKPPCLSGVDTMEEAIPEIRIHQS